MSKGHSNLLRTRHCIGALAVVGLAACIATPERRESSSGPSRMAKPAKDSPIPSEMRKQVRNSEIIGRQIYIKAGGDKIRFIDDRLPGGR